MKSLSLVILTILSLVSPIHMTSSDVIYQTENYSSVSEDLANMGWENDELESDYFLTIFRNDDFTYFYFKFPNDGIDYVVNSINISTSEDFDEESFSYIENFNSYDLTLISQNKNNYQKYISKSSELKETSRIVIHSFNFTFSYRNYSSKLDKNLSHDEYFSFNDANNLHKITSSYIDNYIEVIDSLCQERIIKASDYDILDIFNIVQDVDSVAMDLYYYFFNFNINEIIDDITNVEINYSSFDWSLDLATNINNTGYDPRYISFKTLEEDLSDSTLASFTKSDEKEQFIEIEKGDVYDVTSKNVLLGQKTFHFDRLFEVTSQSDNWILENASDFKYGCLFGAFNRFSSYPPSGLIGSSETSSTYVSEAKILKISYISDNVFYENVAVYDKGVSTTPADKDDIQDADDLIDDNVDYDELTWLDELTSFCVDFFKTPIGIVVLVIVGLLVISLIVKLMQGFINLWK